MVWRTYVAYFDIEIKHYVRTYPDMSASIWFAQKSDNRIFVLFLYDHRKVEFGSDLKF